ncbi:putative amino acid transporter [Nocardia brasiliensis NBRC 14402]|uniref:amino acid permease n=1 Tax=Nocardia brasiliensis TaxID=37326 RepID=UPI00045C89F1|nr:amino acid permease [Nocardia brasiliensis]GAJ85704.1 putative amino acid transporter [Nocardia brasiliensis NBRC 14402]SUB41073.1 Low-affinity putrescine importer PlaP [Nocardia brasiliensis]
MKPVTTRPQRPPLSRATILRRMPVTDSDTGDFAKSMGLWQLVALSLGGLVGAGVFSLAGVVAKEVAGPGVLLSFGIAIVASGAAGLCYAEFAGMVPRAGSAYTYAYVSLGEIVGFLIGWDLLLEYTAIVSVVAIAVSGYLNYITHYFGFDLPTWALGAPGTGAGHKVDLFAVLLCLLLAFLLSRGTRESARVQTGLVMLKMAIVAIVVVAGAFHIKAGNYTPFFPLGVGGAVSGAALAFFAVYGYDAMSAAAEESTDGKRLLPKAIMISLGIASVVYLLVCLVIVGMVNYTDIDVAAPFSSAFDSIGMGILGLVIAVGAVIGVTTSAFANMLAVTRVGFAMSRDGLLPAYFGKSDPRRKVPTRVIWPVGVVSALIAGFLPIREAAELTNVGILMAFIVVAIGVVWLRRTRPEAERTFRTPWVPVVPLLGIGFSVWLISHLTWVTWLRFVLWLLLGVALYFGFSYRNAKLNAVDG